MLAAGGSDNKKHGHITLHEKSVNSTVVTSGSLGPLALALHMVQLPLTTR